MARRALAGMLACVLLFAAGCVERARPDADSLVSAPSFSAPLPPAAAPPGLLYREAGTASWYGREFHGRRMASGETFDMNGISAAHRTLPLGTHLRVTNLDSFKSIKVTVTDRGPFVRGRILELSLGAARELGFAAQGTAQVRIEAVEPVPEGGNFTVLAAAFVEEESARLLRERLTERYEVVSIVPFENNVAKFYRVRVGAYPTEEKAERIAAKLALEGLEPVVMRKD